jgi:hypothetical protein
MYVHAYTIVLYMIKYLHQCIHMINRKVYSPYGPLLSLDEQLYRILQLQIFYAILNLAIYGGDVRYIHHIQAFFLYRTKTTVYTCVYMLSEFIFIYVCINIHVTICLCMNICIYVIYSNMQKDVYIFIHIYI